MTTDTVQPHGITFTIKRVHAGDAALFDHVADEVFDEPIRAERLHNYLRSPGHIMLVAVLDKSKKADTGEVLGEVIGQCAAVIHYHPDKPDELYIDEMGTAGSYRRHGVARALLLEMLTIGRQLGCREAWLGTEPDNDAAQALYRGFKHEPVELFSYFEFPLGEEK